ncbi:hypothetical protein GA0070216_114164 [Micromonospora matsumotoense]|uniref:DUF2637 domain-containing protein n=1 Tax=Micromonospora matsumotoense TaxID=121616 RepID=A0A1C5A8S4_9ACTN|nr:DUF2637 domain-containing protein [Micromonospora matsumotoense]SCF41600.1 hypothetical protein GA0070216_114164 [Micromonospora matsumotoense]
MKTNTERVEGVVLVLIVLTVGGLAGAASFTHVHDWTMANSPAGTGDWFGWANAAISELLPLAALLTIRRRRRTGGPVGYPLFLLVCAVALSLAAQLAVAQPSLSGWLLSAVPALAFLGLSKLVFSTTPTPTASVPPAGDTSADSSDWGAWSPDDQADERPPLRLVDVDQAATAEPARPATVAQRPGLVPVPAAAFAPRNSASGAEHDR